MLCCFENKNSFDYKYFSQENFIKHVTITSKIDDNTRVEKSQTTRQHDIISGSDYFTVNNWRLLYENFNTNVYIEGRLNPIKLYCLYIILVQKFFY